MSDEKKEEMDLGEYLVARIDAIYQTLGGLTAAIKITNVDSMAHGYSNILLKQALEDGEFKDKPMSPEFMEGVAQISYGLARAMSKEQQQHFKAVQEAELESMRTNAMSSIRKKLDEAKEKSKKSN